MTERRLQLEIWSDLVCPWCYIGKRRMDEALAQFEHADRVDVTWRSFELSPHRSAVPQPLDDHLATELGRTPEQVVQMHEQVSSVAAEVGLDYHLDRALVGSSFDAHRIVHLAASQGLAAEAQEQLFSAYMTDGKPISDRETLVDLAGQMGLDAGVARDALETGLYADDVREDERLAGELGISAVPFFVFDRRLAAAGAQPAELLLGGLQQAWDSPTAAPAGSG